ATPPGPPAYHSACPRRLANGPPVGKLLAEIFQCDLDALVIHLLIAGAILITAICAAMEKLDHRSDQGLTLTFDACGASDIDHAVEIEVIDIVVELAHCWSTRRLVADAKHLCSRPEWRNMLIAPPAFLMPQACHGRPVQFEPGTLGL